MSTCALSPGSLFTIKTPFYGYRNAHYNLRRSDGRFKFIMGIPIHIRRRRQWIQAVEPDINTDQCAVWFSHMFNTMGLKPQYQNYYFISMAVLVQDCNNSNVLAMESLQSCTKPSKYRVVKSNLIKVSIAHCWTKAKFDQAQHWAICVEKTDKTC